MADIKIVIKVTWSPGLVVMGGELCSEGCEFES